MTDADAATTTDQARQGEHRPSEGGLPDPDEMSTEEVEEIEAERERRLDPDNRPDMAEVDNTHLEFDFEREELVDADELRRRQSGDDETGEKADHGETDAEDRDQKSTSGLPPLEEIPQGEIDEIEAERERRLDPDNRPDMAEVDNTHLEFDFEREELVDADELRERKSGEGNDHPSSEAGD